MKQRETILASGVSSETPIHTQATARPWKIGERNWLQHSCCYDAAIVGYVDGSCTTVAEATIPDAALIVKAVNRDHHFDELVKALEEISALLPIAQQSGTCITIPHVSEAVHIARAALAGAK